MVQPFPLSCSATFSWYFGLIACEINRFMNLRNIKRDVSAKSIYSFISNTFQHQEINYHIRFLSSFSKILAKNLKISDNAFICF